MSSVLIYKGTGCKKGTTNKVLHALRAFPVFTHIKRTCWTNDPDLWDVLVDYSTPSRWNVIKPPNGTDRWDLVISHSAGFFPLTKTKALMKIAINPPSTKWGTTWIIRSVDDWLVKQKTQMKHEHSRLLWQKGKHGSVDKKLLIDLIGSVFSRETLEEAQEKAGVKKRGMRKKK